MTYIHKHRQTNDKLIVKQAKGLGFMNQAKKDSHVDNNYKFVIHSLQSQVLLLQQVQFSAYNTKTEYIQTKMSTQPNFWHSPDTTIHKLIIKRYETVTFNYIAFY